MPPRGIVSSEVVTAQTQYSLQNARSYFSEHLSVEDYYNEDQRVAGLWFGLGAERLGLSGKVGADEFLRLCENRHPSRDRTLTQRLNSVRSEAAGDRPNRRVFFDFTFSPPKSVSLLALLAQDDRIVKSHAQAVQAALVEFEAFAGTRIRMGGARNSRRSGNVVAALFTHETSRALDPHLHTHAIVFNATWDPVENRWKALENRELLNARKFVENVYYHALARDLHRFGYRLRNRLRGDFEIEGVPQELCARFSKRHAEIDAGLERLLAEKPELGRGDLMELRRRIATDERARKQRDMSQDRLREIWKVQITPGERALLEGLMGHSPVPASTVTVAEAIQWAEEHLLDRNSVVQEQRIWEEALGRARGAELGVEDLTHFTAARGYLRDPSQPGDVTTPEVREREAEIVRIARAGVGDRHPLVWEPGPLEERLDGEQRAALTQLLGSTHAITVFRGGAGTGKSFVLQQLVSQLKAAGRPVLVLAPQRQQVVQMKQDGFPTPMTVAEFLMKRDLPERGVIVVDEAGQIGGTQMLGLLRLASERSARVVLSGDTRQHGPVEASDAMVAIERHAGMQPVELHRIRRQDPALARTRAEAARIRAYRAAVEAAAKGDLPSSFDRLDAMGAIVPCSPSERSERLAARYVEFVMEGASTVVVSQTWGEVHRLNERIRDALKSKGLLGSTETTVNILDRLDLTGAQKRDSRFHPPDSVVVFNQPIRGAQRGATGKVVGFLKSGLLIETEDRVIPVSDRSLDRISVCLRRDIALAEGDRLHLKANRALASGSRVTNGELVTVKAVRAGGDIELVDGRVLDASYREFLPGYAVTSYGSQGKTVDYVLLSDSTIKAATNAQQWYVSISRGRKGICIFTPDKESLKQRILHSGHRPLAVDLGVGHPDARPQSAKWRRFFPYLLRFGPTVVARLRRIGFLQPNRRMTPRIHEHQTAHRKLGV